MRNNLYRDKPTFLVHEGCAALPEVRPVFSHIDVVAVHLLDLAALLALLELEAHQGALLEVAQSLSLKLILLTKVFYSPSISKIFVYKTRSSSFSFFVNDFANFPKYVRLSF